MLIPNKRATLAAAMRGTGVLRGLEAFARRPCLVIFVYHRIGYSGADGFYAPLVSATPEGFRAQLGWMRRQFEMISLGEACEILGDSRPAVLKRSAALVTFDDGYRDNLTVAAPIAERLGVKPALFVTTGFLDGASVPWWDQVAAIVRRSRRDAITIEEPERFTARLSGASVEAAIGGLIDVYIRNGWSADDAALAHLAERAGVELSVVLEAAGGLFLSSSELLALRDAGWGIGAHTRTHRRLASLGEDEQRDELRLSRDRLEALLCQRVDALAYPFGGEDAFNDTTERLASEAGYRVAFALRPAVVWPGACDRFAVARFLVGPSDGLSLLRSRVALTRVLGRSPL